MTRIDRYLFLAAFAPFAAAVFAFLVLFIGTEALSEASKLIARFGLPWQRVMLLLLLRIPWGIAWTLPMATGMAVILAIGRICHDYEYTAIIVGGASFKRVMVPFLVFAGMVTAFALYVQEYLGPATQMEYMQRSNDLVMEARADLMDYQLRLSDMDDSRADGAGGRTARYHRQDHVYGLADHHSGWRRGLPRDRTEGHLG